MDAQSNPNICLHLSIPAWASTQFIIDPFSSAASEELEITADLRVDPAGAHTVERRGCPWGTFKE